MKKYIVKTRNGSDFIGRYDSKAEAAQEMLDYIENYNDGRDETADEYLTPFDFVMEVDEVSDINETVRSYQEAKEFLGKEGFSDKTDTGRRLYVDDEKCLMLNMRHVKALIALNELFTIAQAWNKADGFVPDFADGSQRKWFPWFVYDRKAAGFVCASANSTATYAYAYYGSRLCFKSSERAEQFGKQFIDLWNDVLLFR